LSEIIDDVEQCVDRAIAAVGTRIVLGTPLGLGKPVQLLNAFYRRAEADENLSLHIVTALCLEVPHPGSHIEASLAGPIMQRLFGDYEELAFMQPMRAGTLPANIKVSELYFKAGSMKSVPVAQQNYISSNYTHIARDMVAIGVNVLAQLVAARETEAGLSLSLSCNPDVTPELFQRLADAGRECCKLAQIHPELPFMEHDAEVASDTFDLIVRNPRYDKALFAVPNAAVPINDYATALHASSLVMDGGTLQIGIGSLGDAVAHACILRHHQGEQYSEMLDSISLGPVSMASDRGPFGQGLYLSTEMFVNGMLELIEQGVVRRRVYDDIALQRGLNSDAISPVIDERLYDYVSDEGLLPRQLDAPALERLQYWGIIDAAVTLDGGELCIDGERFPNDTTDSTTRAVLLGAVAGRELRNGRFLHGGFFLGPRDFYRKLREMDAPGREGICMTGVKRTNQLQLDYPLYCAQRRDARFINTGMIVSLGGAVASDALEDGTVISGVGGQYNFVAMAHDLPGARSILCIRSTRGSGKHLQSNIVPFYGHTTIPRHLRDVIVTEYGIADLRGQSDAEVAKRLIAVADSRFQEDLLEFALKHNKIEKGYRLPEKVRRNTPERLARSLEPYRQSGLLPAYPFGTELTEQEITLADSLRKIKALSDEPAHFVATVFRALLHREDEQAARPYLERIHLEHPGTPKDFLVQQLLLLDLEERGLLKVS
tara:strand:- start:3975 stop:6122 length:2148 start_codon:yes stop_codon:yes gene_type:complete